MKKISKFFAKCISAVVVLSMITGFTLSTDAHNLNPNYPRPVKYTVQFTANGQTKTSEQVDANAVLGDRIPSFTTKDKTVVDYDSWKTTSRYDVVSKENQAVLFELTCENEEHTHDSNCKSVTCGKDIHVHSSDCNGTICGKELHSHTDNCYSLTCTKELHEHNIWCPTGYSCGKEDHNYYCYFAGVCFNRNHCSHRTCSLVYTCGKEAHAAHNESCYSLTCEKEEHVAHTKACEGLVCGKEIHKNHTEACKSITCEIDEHKHNSACYTAKVLTAAQVKNLKVDNACYGFEAVGEPTKRSITVTFKDGDVETPYTLYLKEYTSYCEKYRAYERLDASKVPAILGEDGDGVQYINKKWNLDGRSYTVNELKNAIACINFTKDTVIEASKDVLYTVTFFTKHGDKISDAAVAAGQKLSAANIPVVNNHETDDRYYTVIGWSDMDDDSYYQGDSAKELVVTRPINLRVAERSTAKYNVVFLNENDEQIGSTQHIVKGQKAVVPEAPVKANTEDTKYAFDKWVLLTEDSAVEKETDDIVNDVTFKASYKATEYRVVVDPNNNEEATTQWVAAGDKATLPTDLAKEETNEAKYEFAGWAVNGQTVAADMEITAPTEFVAQYDVTAKYAVVFLDEEGQQIGDTQYILEGSKANVPEAPEKAAEADVRYGFDQWVYVPQMLENQIMPLDLDDEEEVKLPTVDDEVYGALTFQATYKATEYRVSFLDEDGETVLGEAWVAVGEKLADEQIPSASKEGTETVKYTFASWLLEEKEADLTAEVISPMTLVAKYTSSEVQGEQFENPDLKEDEKKPVEETEEEETAVLGAEFGNTGDNMPIALMVSLVLISGLTAVIMIRRRTNR